VDGVLAPSEWGGLDPAAGYVLSRTPADEPSKARPSMMWLRRDAADLYIALRHELEPGQNPVPKAQGEPWWGNADIAEVVFEGQGGDWWPTDKGHGPIFYLVGDCTGAFESYAIAGLPKPRAEGLQGAVQYAAMAGAGVWTAEWRIPLAALGLDPDSTKGCSFNVGVHKPRSPSDKWAVWVGAGGANWQVWNAGWLELGK